MLVKEIAGLTRGALLSGDGSRAITPSQISIDSRLIKRGELFLALKGARFNANAFVDAAFKKGAVGAIVGPEYKPSKSAKGEILIRVNNTTKALQDIARYHRMKFDIPVIAVTGSNGKTTVKDMIAHILSTKYNVLKNEGTKNNHIGVPITLLRLKKGHEACVLEMGMNHKGEIRLLAGIARPSIGVITNIGPAHLEFLRSLEGVFEAKSELLESLAPSGLAVLNGDDEFLSGVKAKDFEIARFGFNKSNDFSARIVAKEAKRLTFTLNDKDEFTLNLIGVHNVYNALAAIAVASHLKVGRPAMIKALADYAPAPMRLEVKEIDGIRVINDCYNSNPASMRCALDSLVSYPAYARWVVCGDMLELGKGARHFHELVGTMVAQSGLEGLVTIGRFSAYTHRQALLSGMDRRCVWHCSTHNEAAAILKKAAKRGDAILVKGSRQTGMERVIEKFESYCRKGVRGTGYGLRGKG